MGMNHLVVVLGLYVTSGLTGALLSDWLWARRRRRPPDAVRVPPIRVESYQAVLHRIRLECPDDLARDIESVLVSLGADAAAAVIHQERYRQALEAIATIQQDGTARRIACQALGRQAP
jgi:hypothetical protein